MKIAERISNLGTETAFAVSGEARAFAAAGNTVYPFHLGDMNIRTPDNIINAAHQAMLAGKTGYAPNAGIPELREALAEDVNRARGSSYTAANVAIQPGGKPVIGKFIQAVMNPGDEVLYPNPGYPIYESQIEYYGGRAVPYGYVPGDENFRLDFDALEKSVTTKTRLLIFNDLQNPTGAESSREELEAVARFAVKHDLKVLCDEAYFDIRYGGESISLSSFPGMEERCIILYTFSKKFAMTGWRLGAAIGPVDVIDVIARINLNDESCSNHFIQVAAVEALKGDQSGPRKILEVLKERRDLGVDILNSIPGISCYRPNATFYLYPDVTELMEKKGFDNYETFRKDVLHKTGVSFCTRLHFGRALPGEERKYIRLAYSGIDADLIRKGLGLLKEYSQK
ncbi:aminotransferase class I/II-fold pyridoxal phosphate-dependent enzyme [Marispirochaeta aestuarii]|uniref:pyridoxal phosphate-dependent aminotransferase n=1 Tax=Marispirochaeta aestuarii TaxID=1963862 RepID=UPI0029C9924F|nr:aminotransferase class I/II-fold pyridoxal phosphate-dependent enzyme [Marispirochaeta aestuarii]